MSDRHIAKRLPYKLDLVEGETYYWCSCGLSQSQPLCDGSHAGSDHEPVAHVAEDTGAAFFCGCKATKNEPMCDGSHGTL